MRALICSDTHIGHPASSYEAIGRLLQEAKQYDEVIFAGDTFELIWATPEDIQFSSPYKFAYHAIADLVLFQKPRVKIVAGNHDPKDKLQQLLPLAHIEDRTYLGAYEVRHGHQFDTLIKPMDKALGWLYRFLPFWKTKVWGTPFQEKLLGERERWDYHQMLIAQKALQYVVARKDSIDGLVYGHTHFPFAQRFPTEGVELLNTGDMCDSRTYLVREQGQWLFHHV